MTNDVKFSVVIPLYNKEKYIYDCLMSVANQDYTASEIIVINDGSTDDSLIVINKLEQNISNLVVVNQKNGGEAVARNTGIKKTRYEYIVFLDADDFWLPNHLSQINQLIHEYPDCELFCSQYCAIMRNHKKKEMRLPIINGTHMRVSNYFDYLYNGYGFVNSSNSCVRKKLFDEIGFFKTMKLGSDFDMWCRILEKYSLAIYFVESVQINLDAENRVSIRYVGEIPPFIMELKKRIVDEHIVESRCLSVNRYLNLLITKQVIHMLLNGNIIESKKLYSERVDLDELHLYEKIMNIIIYFPSKILGIGVFILNKIGFIGYLYRKSFR